MNTAYIVAGYRSAVGKSGKGVFRFTRPDDLGANVIKHLIESGEKQRIKPSRLASSEVVTILIAFHQSGFRDFKTYYTNMSSIHTSRH